MAMSNYGSAYWPLSAFTHSLKLLANMPLQQLTLTLTQLNLILTLTIILTVLTLILNYNFFCTDSAPFAAGSMHTEKTKGVGDFVCFER